MWDKKIFLEHEKIRQEIYLGGGKERIEHQHKKGKFTARERVEQLIDPGTFHELDNMVLSRTIDFGMEKKKKYGDGIVAGYGKINGRLVFLSSQDFTVCGGSGGEEYALKMCRLIEMALQMKAPVININDSGGARIEEGICSLSGYSRLFYLNTLASGVIPQIALILGPCAGGASYSPALCDFIFMVEHESQMYLTGPKVVEVSIGEKISMEELGGVDVHMTKSGVAHFSYPSENTCFEGVKKLLSYLPQSNKDKPIRIKTKYSPVKTSLQKIVPENPRKIFDVTEAIIHLLDDSSFFEVQKYFAKNIVIGFGRLDGEVIGVIANQSTTLGGAIDYDAADKAARFVRVCDCFNIPLITFVDIPAFYPGSKQEQAGIIRHGAKLLYAFAEATVPKICLIMRKAYGGAFCAMNSKELGADIVFAWPIAEIAVMGAEGAVNIVYRKQIAEADNPEKARQEYIEDYERKFLNPYFAAEHGFVDEVIHPDETRERLRAALEMLRNKEAVLPYKKHGNIPL